MALSSVDTDEEILRVLYYDCPPFSGKLTNPVSGEAIEYKGHDSWLHKLGRKNYFALRLGKLKFDGWRYPEEAIVDGSIIEASKIRPTFVQKGVDMRIGIDIASYAFQRTADRIILISGDTDCIPALKMCRQAGLQAIHINYQMPFISWDLQKHADFVRIRSLVKPS